MKTLWSITEGGGGGTQGRVIYERFQLSGFAWESFGVLYRWLLKGGGRLLEDFACGRSIILYRGKQIHFCQLFCGTAMMIIIIIVYLSLQINIKICGEYSETMSIGIVEQ